ncbi:MAG: serine hydrolase domain-containing protein [Nocardioides sp.]
MTDLDDATRRALSGWVRSAQFTARQPSFSAAVARDGELVWAEAVGYADGRPGGVPATPETAYRVGSVTKTFVAVAVLQLVAEGRVGLDDPVSRHVPDAPVGDVTVAQLLSHTSGLQAETDGDWWERSPGYTWEALVAQGTTRRFGPGRKYHYSNLGYAVLGRLLETLELAPWDEVVDRKLLSPLGMRRTGRVPPVGAATGWGVHPHAALLHHEPVQDYLAMGPAGEFWSTTGDLAVWGSFLVGAIAGPLGAQLLEQMREPWTVNDLPGLAWTGAHGLGLQLWNIDGRRQLGHSGSVPGFTCELRCDLQTSDVVVSMGSATTGYGGALGLLELWQELMPRHPAPWTADPSQVDVVDLVGTWYWGTMPYVIEADAGGRLVAIMQAGTRTAQFRPDGPDRWVGLSSYFDGELLTVGRDPAGTPLWLDVASFRLTRTPYAVEGNVPGGVDETGWH